MTENPDNTKCFICNRRRQLGPGFYDGPFIPLYQFGVCGICYRGNWDGWAPQHEERILAHLQANGIPMPARDYAGLLPRD